MITLLDGSLLSKYPFISLNEKTLNDVISVNMKWPEYQRECQSKLTKKKKEGDLSILVSINAQCVQDV